MDRQKGGRGGRKDHYNDPIVKISKNLSYLLRHGAIEEKLNIDKAGYVLLSEILEKPFYKSKGIGEKQIREIVDNNDKKRFELKTESDAQGRPALYIRASQGHSIKVVEDEGLLEKITDPSQLPVCVHGTTRDAWKFIQTEGLKPMSRNHVHFAVGYPGEDEVISGMRKSCSVFIELDVEKALKDGMEILISKNGVILTRGLNGIITPAYFKRVLVRTNEGRKEIDFRSAQDNAMIIEEHKEEEKGKKGKAGNLKAEQESMSKKIAEAKKPKEPLKYLCVLDFEAQCKKDETLPVQEIVEFPVVVIDIEKKEILEDYFHYYIKPTEFPTLFPFCTELTGITQDKVDNGILLPEALEKLDAFLASKGILESSFVFLTCGNWDLCTCLKKEAQFKKIPVKEYLKSWLNIKEAFPTNAGDRPPRGMTEMLEYCGLPLIGKHHSGIDDTNNIAKIALHLLKNGFQFSHAHIGKTSYKS